MQSLVLERSEPCPHERVLEPPSRRNPGQILAQEMLAFECLERACELLHVVGDVLADVEDVLDRTRCDCGPRRLESPCARNR
jgi:hypothetical protein